MIDDTKQVWIVELEEDPETGDLIMPLPMELIESQGWKIGDTLVWDLNEAEKTATLKKKKDGNETGKEP